MITSKRTNQYDMGKGYKSKTKSDEYKSKPYRKRRYGSSKISSVTVRGNPGFPDELMTTLVYVQNGTFSGSVTPSAKVFNANGLYDPDYSVGGHQPKYFDQLQAMYTQYLVLGVKYEVEWNNATAVAAFGVVTFNDTDISSRTVESLQENRYAHSVSLGAIGGRSTKSVKGYMSIGKLHGQSKLDQDPNQYAGVGANPNMTAFMILKASASDGATSLTTYWKVKLTFYVKFKDLADPGQS